MKRTFNNGQLKIYFYKTGINYHVLYKIMRNIVNTKINFLLLLKLLLTSFLFNNYCMSQCSQADINMQLCELKSFYNFQKSNLNNNGLLGEYLYGNTKFLSPKFFAERIDLLTDKETENERLWLLSLYTLSIDLADKSGLMSDLDNNDKYSDLLGFIKSHSKDIENFARGSMPLADRTVFANEFGRCIRDFLVTIKAFKNNNSTIFNAWGRVASAASGIYLVATGIKGLTDDTKARFLASSIIVRTYFEDYVIPSVRNSSYFSMDPSLRNAITKHSIAGEIYKQAEEGLILQEVFIDAAATLLTWTKRAVIAAGVGAVSITGVGAIPAVVVGAIIEATVNLSIGFLSEQIKEGFEFIYYFDIATRLFTLSLKGNEPAKDIDILIASSSLNLGLYQIKNFVVGKGLVQKVTWILSNVFDNEEKKWNKYLIDSYNPQESKINHSISYASRCVERFSSEVIYCSNYKNYFIFLIDVSLSMGSVVNGKQKIQIVKEALPDIIKELKIKGSEKENAYSLITFSCGGTQGFDRFGNSGMANCDKNDIRTPIVVPFTHNITQIVQGVNNLNAFGCTPLISGIETAYQYADNIPELASGMIILLSDGEQNCPNFEKKALEKIVRKDFDIKRKNVVLSTIAYGEENKEHFNYLKSLANDGNGIFIKSTDPFSLKYNFRNTILSKSMFEDKLINGSIIAGGLLLLLLLALI